MHNVQVLASLATASAKLTCTCIMLKLKFDGLGLESSHWDQIIEPYPLHILTTTTFLPIYTHDPTAAALIMLLFPM